MLLELDGSPGARTQGARGFACFLGEGERDCGNLTLGLTEFRFGLEALVWAWTISVANKKCGYFFGPTQDVDVHARTCSHGLCHQVKSEVVTRTCIPPWSCKKGSPWLVFKVLLS